MVKEINPSDSIVETIEFSHGIISLRSDGIVEVNLDNDILYTLKEARQVSEAVRKITNGIPKPVLKIAGKYASIDDGARKYAAKEGIKFSKVEAIVISSLAQKLIGNFYLQFNKPLKPTRIFTNKEDAEKWLLTFV